MEDERREVLPGALAVRLAALGCVDAREPDAVFFMRCIEEGERVAVGDRDDLSDDLGAAGGGRYRKNEQSENDTRRDTGFLLRPRLCRCVAERTRGGFGEARRGLYPSTIVIPDAAKSGGAPESIFKRT
jgi:hypothetical protein